MKRIAISLLVIGMLATSVTQATFAVFSDSSQILGNTLSTAQVNIDARAEESSSTLPKPIAAVGLVPGEWSEWYRGIVFNQADSTNVRVFLHLNNVTGGACGKTNLMVTTGQAGSEIGERTHVIFNGNVAELAGSENRRELTGYTNFPAPEYLPANWSLVVQQQAQLDVTADNAQANTSCTWDEVFVAETPVP